MSTLIEITQRLAEPRLHRADPYLEPDEQRMRCLYATTKLLDWIRGTLPSLKGTHETSVRPKEQFEQLLYEFVSGKDLYVPRGFHILQPEVSGIWELKTTDIRVFGWFYVKGVFIGVNAGQAQEIKAKKLYGSMRDEAQIYRDALDIDPPKFIPGTLQRDVI